MNDSITSVTLKDGATNFEIPSSLQQTTLLFFMRAASCAICVQHVKQLQSMLPEFEQRNLAVIVIVPEDATATTKLKEKYSLTMPLMAGNGTAHLQVGLEKKMLGLLQQSGTIIVDKDGRILYQNLTSNPLQSFNRSQIETFLHS